MPDSPEVCLVVPDLKGKRNEPDEAIDHYKELLKNNDITSITEVNIPIFYLFTIIVMLDDRESFFTL